MRSRVLAILILLAQSGPLCFSQNLYSQQVRFKESIVSIRTAFKEAEAQKNIHYIIQSGNHYLDSLIKMPGKKIRIDVLLSAIEKKYPLTFTVENNTILMEEKASPSIKTEKTTLRPSIFTGIVENENGEPLEGANVQLKGSILPPLQSDRHGLFEWKNDRPAPILHISYGKMDTSIQVPAGASFLRVRLKTKVLEEVVVKKRYTNGYQPIYKENAVASVTRIDQELIERKVSPAIGDRIENMASGILLPHGGQTADGSTIQDPLLIRGRSTLFANAAPLYVVDNFPYDGNIININSNDVESISILKDAAATSIWGARAGNGVIVIVTKKARSALPKLVYNTSISLQQRPNLFNIRSISSPDFLDFENFLFTQHYYDGVLSDPNNYTPVTPGVGIYYAEQQGQLSQTAGDAQLAALRKQDVRNDMRQYLYRTSMNQEHSIQLSGSTPVTRYYLSAGWDHDISGLVASQFDRITLRSANNFQAGRNLQLEAGVNFTETTSRNGDNIQFAYHSPLLDRSLYPYAGFSDPQHRPLAINLDYNADYLQQTSALGFPNWEFKPLNELSAEVNKTRVLDYLLTSGIQYKILPSLALELRYQFEDQVTEKKDLHSDSSYYTRDQVNGLIQVDPTTNALYYPLPMGDILDLTNLETTSHQGRLQLNYTHQWGAKHTLDAIGGYEIRSLQTTSNTNRYYGYDPTNSSINTSINYGGSYLQYLTYTNRAIVNPQVINQLTDHFISYYANAGYSYQRRYNIYGSIRKDEANLFGVATNEKGVPLWSAGLAWQINKENWYLLKGLPFLKLRATYGASGNIARLASASTAASGFPGGGVSGSSYPMLIIQSPPNKNLRWEQVRQLNIGIDFATSDSLLTGTIEWYQKRARDLLVPVNADPTLGLVQTPGIAGNFYTNMGGVNGKGIDLQLSAHYFTHRFKWIADFLFSYSASKVQQYQNPAGLGNLYLNQTVINPVHDKPIYSLYSFNTAGLDGQTGSPIVNGKNNLDYNAVYNNTPLDSMQFHGPAQPVYFGSLRNSFSLGPLSFSFMLSYQMGHYYRQPSISYIDLALHWRGNSDFTKRWQHPGDEKRTNVPSLLYPIDPERDAVYLNSSSLVKRSDEIRWEDITIGYDLDKEKCKRLPFQHIRIYGTMTGVGLLWTANKDGIDPYYINVPKERPRYSIGLRFQFLPLKSTP